jgi:hypothetical protein
MLVKRAEREDTMTPQEFVADAKARKDWAWTYFQVMRKTDREAFDKWLVEEQHPLAYVPGTTESRFRSIVAA